MPQSKQSTLATPSSYRAREAMGICTQALQKDSFKVSKDTEMESRWEYFLFSTSNQKANHYFVNDGFLREHCALRQSNGRNRWGRHMVLSENEEKL